MIELYRRRRDLVCDALQEIGVRVRQPHATIYVWAPVPEGFESSAAYCEHVLEEAGVVISPGRDLRAGGRGLVPDLADDARRAAARGGASGSASFAATETQNRHAARSAEPLDLKGNG